MHAVVTISAIHEHNDVAVVHTDMLLFEVVLLLLVAVKSDHFRETITLVFVNRLYRLQQEKNSEVKI